jgi:multiple sugar transport system substrate-binding protein
LSTAAVSAEEIVLTYWGIASSSQQEYDLVESFNQLYASKIRVQAMAVSSMNEKLAVAIAGNSAPEIVRFDRFGIPEWAFKGLLQPLDAFIKNDNFDLSDFYPAAVAESVFEGKTYGIPWYIDARAYLYNKQHYLEAGLDPAQPATTWDQAVLYGRRLDRVVDGRFERAGFFAVDGNFYFVGWLFTAGGEVTDPTGRQIMWDSPAGLRAANFMVENAKHYGGMSGVSAAKSGDTRVVTAGGRISSLVDVSSAIANILKANPNIDLGVSAPPRPTELANQPITWSGGFSYVIPSSVSTERAAAAWEFIKYVTSKETQVLLMDGSLLGRFPSRRSAILDPRYQQIQPPQMNIKVFFELLNYTRFRPIVPNGETLWNLYYSQIRDRLLNKNLPPEQVLSETARQAQIALDAAWASRK